MKSATIPTTEIYRRGKARTGLRAGSRGTALPRRSAALRRRGFTAALLHRRPRLALLLLLRVARRLPLRVPLGGVHASRREPTTAQRNSRAKGVDLDCVRLGLVAWP